MSIERVRLQGLQSRSLELGGKRRDHSTPTKDSDISQRARAFKGMLGAATFHTMALEGAQEADQLDRSEEALRAIRGDVVRSGHSLVAFDMLVKDNVALAKRKAQEEAEDEKLVEETFSEHQAFKGETPVNWGNHAKKDPFGL